jgi:predicted transcriptional regulator
MRCEHGDDPISCMVNDAMKTLTIPLNDQLERTLRELARRQGRSETELALDVLEQYAAQDIPDWVGIGESEEAQLSQRDEQILKTEWH